jgi:DNA polymerase III delta prime subunit
MLLKINNDLPSKNYRLKKPWAEKYRPCKFENLILNPSLDIKFSEILNKNEVPNMILTGYPGSGKTSTVLCLAKKIINNNFDDNYLEFNASDNRGLDIIKNRIYSFCRRKTNNNYLKIVILDEADNLTKKAQSTISNFMEEYKSTTRFLFTCNSNNNIIESIQSKCFLVNFTNLDKHKIIKRLEYICTKENLDYDLKSLELINYISLNDIRKCINLLETVSVNGEISIENIYKIYDKPDPVIIRSLLEHVLNREFMNSVEVIDRLYDKGYCNSDILQIVMEVLKEYTIPNKYKISMLDIVSQFLISINEGNDTRLQMYTCLTKLIKIIN